MCGIQTSSSIRSNVLRCASARMRVGAVLRTRREAGLREDRSHQMPRGAVVVDDEDPGRGARLAFHRRALSARPFRAAPRGRHGRADGPPPLRADEAAICNPSSSRSCPSRCRRAGDACVRSPSCASMLEATGGFGDARGAPIVPSEPFNACALRRSAVGVAVRGRPFRSRPSAAGASARKIADQLDAAAADRRPAGRAPAWRVEDDPLSLGGRAPPAPADRMHSASRLGAVARRCARPRRSRSAGRIGFDR